MPTSTSYHLSGPGWLLHHRAGSCSKTRSDISLPSFLSQQESLFIGWGWGGWGVGLKIKKKRAKRNSERMVITSWLATWGSKALEGGRLNDTPTARGKFGKKSNSKRPSINRGNKTSLPSPGSNCCFEKNPHIKVSIRKPFWFRRSLCPKCNRRPGGIMSMEGGDRGAHRPGLSSGFGCCPRVLGTTWLTLGGRTFWSPWCITWEKPVATTEPWPVASIRQNPLWD